MRRLPFNIWLLSPSSSSTNGQLAVQSLDVYDPNSTEYNSQGLYSVEIFGTVGTEKRLKQFSYMNLRTKILHPKIFLDLYRLKGLYKGIASSTMYAKWDPELMDFVRSDIIDGKTGYSFLMEHFKELKFIHNKSPARDLRIKILDKYRNACEYNFIPILPAGLRDIEIDENNRTTEDEINALYRRVLRASNTINVHNNNNNSPVLDTVRWNIQKTVLEIYQHIESVIEGKRGFLAAKYGSRNIHRGTRNVITAIEPAPLVLGSPEAITVNDTVVGLYQYMKATVELCIHDIKNGVMKPVIADIPISIKLIDKRTLTSTEVQPTSKAIEDWGTAKGIESLINAYFKPNNRQKPVVVDGKYVALVYNDGAYCKVFYDINELPSDKDISKVTPITWCELFYISVFSSSRECIAAPTRYPIFQADGSIYPSMVYLKTTVKSDVLTVLDDNWEPTTFKYISFPIKTESSLDSMNVHISKMPGLAADLDGDKCNLHIGVSKEVKEAGRNYLNSKAAFLQPDGSLKYGINNNTSTLVVYNLSYTLNHPIFITVEELQSKDYDEAISVSVRIKQDTNSHATDMTATELIKSEKDKILKFTAKPNLYLIGKVDKKIVGILRVESTGKTGAFGIGLLPEYRGKGYGNRLIHVMLSKLRREGYTSIYLNVDKSNTKAIDLYKRNGFILDGEKDKTISIMKYLFD